MNCFKMIVFIIGAGSILLTCESDIAQNRSEVESDWSTESGGEKYVFSIERDSGQKYSGSVTTYRAGTLVSKMALGKITYQDTLLVMVTNPDRNVVFKGKLSSDKQMLGGYLYYENGSGYPFNLKDAHFLHLINSIVGHKGYQIFGSHFSLEHPEIDNSPLIRVIM